MAGYTKLFSSIVTSTVWREGKETKIMWVTMLALADKDGVVEGSIPGLADMARLTVAEARTAIEILSAPDPDSRSKEAEGKRLVPIDGGWLLVNHAKYRDLMSVEERREYLRKKQAEFRAKAKTGLSTVVNNCSDQSTPSTHSAAAAEATPEAGKKEDSAASPLLFSVDTILPFPSAVFREAWTDFVKHRQEIRKKMTPMATKHAWKELAAMGEQRAIVALNHTIAKGWQGIREPDAVNGPAARPSFADRNHAALVALEAKHAREYANPEFAKHCMDP